MNHSDWSARFKEATSMLVAIAFLQFRQGRPDEATATGRKALRSLGHDPNPQPDRLLADLMTKITEHLNKRAREERPDADGEREDT